VSKGQKQIGEMGGPGGPVGGRLLLAIKGCGRQRQSPRALKVRGSRGPALSPFEPPGAGPIPTLGRS
jgi:hypothetical protein